MENNHTQNGFSYTYSAKDRAEVIRIREKYASPLQDKREDKMERLRRLDASVTKSALIVALILGVLGTLILGFGMSLIMTDMAAYFGIEGNSAMVIGIAVGILGSILASLAYPIYHALVIAKRKKLAPEILRLTDELMK